MAKGQRHAWHRDYRTCPDACGRAAPRGTAAPDGKGQVRLVLPIIVVPVLAGRV